MARCVSFRRWSLRSASESNEQAGENTLGAAKLEASARLRQSLNMAARGVGSQLQCRVGRVGGSRLGGSKRLW